jgi:cytochrome oxidase assembly protein ShyY1
VNGWHFAFNRRWFGYLAAAIVFAIGCVLLSQWQFARRDAAVAEINRVETNFDATAQPITEVLPELSYWQDDLRWRPVTMTGTYLADEQLLVRNRPFNGQNGYEVLTPLLLTDGTIFIVDRGWLPFGADEARPDSVPAAPTGTVTVTARLKASEPSLPGRSAPAGQVPTIKLDDIAALLDQPTYTGAYGLVANETPSVADNPLPAVKPTPDEGPHLSYAIQWIAFALFGFFGLGYALRQEYRLVNADDPAERERAAVRRAKASTRKKTDADIEDELLDAR